MNYWEEKAIGELSDEQWETLCDRCGRCCLHKLEDDVSGEIFFTNVVCRYLDNATGCCRHYDQRQTLVPECLVVRRDRPEQFAWLPASCAYRRLAEGKALESWHPLISGYAESVHEAGISVCGKVVSDEYIHPDQIEEHIIDWVK